MCFPKIEKIIVRKISSNLMFAAQNDGKVRSIVSCTEGIISNVDINNKNKKTSKHQAKMHMKNSPISLENGAKVDGFANSNYFLCFIIYRYI